MTIGEISLALQDDVATIALAKALAATNSMRSVPVDVELLWLATPEPIRLDYVRRAQAIAALLVPPARERPKLNGRRKA